MGKNVFVTGASGFLGKELVNRFLMDGSRDHFYLLVRSDGKQRDLEEKYKWVQPGRIDYVHGDIEKSYVGISGRQLEKLAGSVDEVWHMAASTSFDDSKRMDIKKTNLAGTQNVLDLAGEFPKLSRFYYMGTAYVCGENQGVIPEGEFDKPKSFKNLYEETKFDCESKVRSSGLPQTVLRPSIIVGDSRTGDAKGENRMFYGYLLALYRSALHMFGDEEQFRKNWKANGERPDVNARLFGSVGTTKNIVTIDDVVNVCDAVRGADDNLGKTYNIVNVNNLTMGDATSVIEDALRIKGFSFDSSLSSRDRLNRDSVAERAAHRFTKQFWKYFQVSEPDWKHDNVDELGVKRVDMTVPLFDFMMKTYVNNELMRRNGD
jgi:nucleoside-diphosphate-sugar epimerase